jgi:hypothetical protein
MGTGSIRPYAADAIKSVLFPIGRLFETANDFMIFFPPLILNLRPSDDGEI